MGYAIAGEYLVREVDGCNCDGGGFGHRPECGLEPVAKIAEIEASLEAIDNARKRARDHDVPSSNPTIEELEAEGVPRNVAVLIQPFLNRWASEVGDLSRAIRSALTG